MTVDVYRNAYKEVYEILQNLVEEDYNKIPKEVINVLEENKNDEYEIYLDDELDSEREYYQEKRKDNKMAE